MVMKIFKNMGKKASPKTSIRVGPLDSVVPPKALPSIRVVASRFGKPMASFPSVEAAATGLQCSIPYIVFAVIEQIPYTGYMLNFVVDGETVDPNNTETLIKHFGAFNRSGKRSWQMAYLQILSAVAGKENKRIMEAQFVEKQIRDINKKKK